MTKTLKYIFVNVVAFLFWESCYKFLGSKKTRILMYHKICDLKVSKPYAPYVVSPSLFDSQMKLLFQNKINIITPDQLIRYKETNVSPPKKSVIITFDDGFLDNYVNAFPILEKYGFKATFFVITNYVGSVEPIPWPVWDNEFESVYKNNKLSWLPLSKENILYMSSCGHVFGSHTQSHPQLNGIDEDMAAGELEGSKKKLESILSKPVLSFCYPYGEFNEKVKTLVKASGYKLAVCSKSGGNTIRSDFFELKRIIVAGDESMSDFKNKISGRYEHRESLLAFVKMIRQFFSGSKRK